MATASKVFKPTGRVWFTSDTHFGHALMLERRGFIDRPAEDLPPDDVRDALAEMDRTLVANWNAIVEPTDTVFHLGDVFWKLPTNRMRAIFDSLNGRKNLVIGNHDFGRADVLKLGWATPPEHRRFLKVDGQKIVLDHYSGRTWAGSNNGAIQLYGHSHGRMPSTDRGCDVGVDAWQLMPVDIDQIRTYLAEQPRFWNVDAGEEPAGDEETSTFTV